ncbi:hypothetical protein JAAARDRAFT_295700 [Jaapia argillacea MUCL 33604]|uniref:Uncharacterized protein n=1 Tax=Jaapia argillacea MUCL 33604 TaxID=933084 RepID=A0A067Q1V0_9AGAM|nr:hypothetical protein JAAARDRAFT_295700 [Jaapia argillacea MUCL 33604]
MLRLTFLKLARPPKLHGPSRGCTPVYTDRYSNLSTGLLLPSPVASWLYFEALADLRLVSIFSNPSNGPVKGKSSQLIAYSFVPSFSASPACDSRMADQVLLDSRVGWSDLCFSENWAAIFRGTVGCVFIPRRCHVLSMSTGVLAVAIHESHRRLQCRRRCVNH